MTTMTKTQNAQQAGTYAPTTVDSARALADIVVTGYVGRDRTEFRSSRKFSGPGIKMVKVANGTAIYTANEVAMTELRRRYSVATDF